MKEKLRIKRFLSVLLSAALTFNLSSAIPSGIFAESTDPASDITTNYNGHKYQIFDQAMYWKDAKAYCESLGGHLATLTDTDEREFIENFAKENGNKIIYWLGATDEEKEGEWKWITGEDDTLLKKTSFDNDGPEDYLSMMDIGHWYWNDWQNSGNDGQPVGAYSYSNLGFICEWEPQSQHIDDIKPVSEYTVFSSDTSSFFLTCWQAAFNGNVYTGSDFVSCASELEINGKIDAVNDIIIYGWKRDIDEENSESEIIEMPDWDARINKMAGDYEVSSDDVVKIEDKNVISGAIKTSGNVEISGTTFDGDCYIIADGNITYNVCDFVSTGRVVLYSKNGNITINGTDIDMNGIMYAPNGTVAYNTYKANINGRIFAKNINLSGSIFNITGSDSDWELLGSKNVITKTYTTDQDFNEGTYDNTGLDMPDELTLTKHDDNNDGHTTEYTYDIDDQDVKVSETVSRKYVSLNDNDISVSYDFSIENNHRYQLFDDGITWTQAKAACEKLGGHLVTITDADEWQIIEDMFRERVNKNDNIKHLWLGGYYDHSDDTWKWVDSTPFIYANWDNGEPNNDRRGDECEDYIMCYSIPNKYNSSSVAYKWNSLYDDGDVKSGEPYLTKNYCYICEWEDGPQAADLSFTTTVPDFKWVNAEKISPAPDNITKNQDGSAVLTWNSAQSVVIPYEGITTEENIVSLLCDSKLSAGNASQTMKNVSIPVRGVTDSQPYNHSYCVSGAENGIKLDISTDKSSLNIPQDTINAEFDLSGFGTAQTKENDVDLLIVADCSGSMDGSKSKNEKTAIKEVISQMSSNDRCALIGFSYSPSVFADFTSDKDVLNSAVDKLYADGGTYVSEALDKAIKLFSTLENPNKKYIMFVSDGQDCSSASDYATKAYENDIRFHTLAIGGDYKQLRDMAEKGHGIYLSSPDADQIGEMMRKLASEVFDNAGEDVSFEITIPKTVYTDDMVIDPKPEENIENEDGSRTLRWKYNSLSVTALKKISISYSLDTIGAGTVALAQNISCKYLNNSNESATVDAHDLVVPVHNYASSGTWTTVFDSEEDDTVWKNINWNGTLYDDSSIKVKASAANTEDSFGDPITVNNYENIESLSGRFIRLTVELNESSTGKTPELFDITLMSEGAAVPDYTNNAPQVSLNGSDTTFANQKLFLISQAQDDCFAPHLEYTWECGDENAQICTNGKPYTSVRFSQSGEYTVKLSVSDSKSSTTVTKKINVLNSEIKVTPEISLDVPEYVKAGGDVSGRINILNQAEISAYEVMISGKQIPVNEDGSFTFTVPDEDCTLLVNAKAVSDKGLTGESSASVIVDAVDPEVSLSSASDTVLVGNSTTVTAFISDLNGIKEYSVKCYDSEITLDTNHQYKFIPDCAGEYVFVLTAKDNAGNDNQAQLVINVSDPVPDDTDGPQLNWICNYIVLVGHETEVNLKASDPSGVAELSAKVNGTPVTLDENGAFRYTPSEIGDMIVDIHAEDVQGNATDYPLVIRVAQLSMTTDKKSYSEGETITFDLGFSSNLSVEEQMFTVDDKEISIKDSKVVIDGLTAGEHKFIWYLKDSCGEILTGTMTFNIKDAIAPEVEILPLQSKLIAGDTFTAEVIASDENGIKELTAKYDGVETAITDNKLVVENLTEGKHSIEVTATDSYGNTSTGTYEFTVLSKKSSDTTAPELTSDVQLTEDNKLLITASATDDSGNAEITGTVNGNKLTFNDGTAYYDPDGFGDFEIIIRAEDAAGNYAQKTQTVTISEQIKRFELKLSVGLDKNNVKTNEAVNISVRTNSLLEDVTVSCTADGGNLTETDGGYIFVSDKEGTFELIVKVTDESGNAISETVYITVSNEKQDDEDGEGEYENTYTPEPRARVILDSKEKTETKMTEEMADLADHLKTPLEVYEYLYNNLNTEYYIGSRKGAVGAYEQKAGNDVDCSSLLIAMLRYLGYDAEYVTGEVAITKPQLMTYTATDTLENAEKVYMLLGRPLTRFSDGYILNHTWVKTVIDGKEYQLDVNFKKFKPVSGIAKEIEMQNLDLDIADFKTYDDANAIYNQYKDQASLTSVNLSNRLLVNKKISNLPLTLPYECNKIVEETQNVATSSVIPSDSITIVFGSSGHAVNAARAYLDPISIQYVPSDDYYNDQMGGMVKKPANIYAKTEDAYAVPGMGTICPALFLNNEKIKEFDKERVSIGDTQQVVISTSTRGKMNLYTESRELIVGSIVSVVLDTQTISPQAILTAYENYKDIRDSIDTNNFFESGYCDNYLNFIGTSYFAQLDAQNTIYASTYDIYKERELSFGLFNYEPIVDTTSVMGLTTSTTLTKRGNFGLDILGAYNQTMSRRGNIEDVKAYLFASGYISSYLESKTLQQFTGVKSISTAEVFRQCTETGIALKMISEKNQDDISALQISQKDKSDITQLVQAGNLVIVPEKNISVNQWTGTAYIVQSSDGMNNTFVITGDKNGGYSTVDLVAYMIISTIGAGVDMYSMIFGFVAVMGAILAMPLGIVAVAAAILVTVVFAYLVVQWAEDYQQTCDLYFRALDGDVEAANQLNKKAFLATIFMAIDFATGGVGGNKGLGPDDIPSTQARKTALSGKGCADDAVETVFNNMKNVDSCSDDLLEVIAKSSKPAEVAETLSKYSDEVIEAINKSADKDAIVSLIAKHGDDAVSVSAKSSSEALRAISGLSDDAAEKFFKAAGKHGDELASAINKSAHIDDAVSFVSKYTDDGAELFLRHGDDAVAAVKGCDAPYKAIEIIKNGGLQYGDEAVQALKKSGDKAVEALTKVPTRECAELVAKHGDDAADVIVTYGDKAVQAAAKCSNPDMAADAIRLMKNNSKNTVEAINRYGDDAVAALNKINKSNQKKCSKYILDYGDDAVDTFSRYGNDAYLALDKCSDACKKDALAMMRNEDGMAVRYINRNGDAGVQSLGKYSGVNPETGAKNGWTYVTDPLPDDFTCINKDLAGKTHPKTGVPFEKRTVTVGGKESEVVVPKFDSSFEATLPDDLIKSTDTVQFSECNAQLKEALERNPELKSKFSDKQLQEIAAGNKPNGYTWHHDAETGRMQLVDYKTHLSTNHTGGRAIWGGGSEAR